MAKKKKDLSWWDIFFIWLLVLFAAVPITLEFLIKDSDAIVIYDNDRAMRCRRLENYIWKTGECVVSLSSRYSSKKVFLLDNIKKVYYKEGDEKEYRYLKSILWYYANMRVPNDLLDNVTKLP